MNKDEIFIDIVFTQKTILKKIHYSKTFPNITKLPVNYSRDVTRDPIVSTSIHVQ